VKFGEHVQDTIKKFVALLFYMW